MTAESQPQPRHPLELLRQLQPEVETLLGFIRGAVTYHADPNHIESVLGILTQNALEKLNLLAVCSPHEAQREVLIHKLMDENAALRAQAEAEADVMAERDSLLSGLREAVQVWTRMRDCNCRNGAKNAEIIYSTVVNRALDILNDQETDEPALAQAGGESC